MSSIIQAQQDTIKERFIDTQNELTVLSWNIQMLPNSLAMFSRALRKKQAIRCPWIIAYLQEISPDVICFQEVFDRAPFNNFFVQGLGFPLAFLAFLALQLS